jgi:signal transduction histidine kinase/CheY-like chemotaxis protein
MGLYFSISGLLFIIILMYNFFSKERINSLETKIYKYMIILTSFGLLLDIITCIIFNAGLDYHSIAYVFASKFVFAYFVVWFLLFAFYIKSISITNVDNRKNLLNTTFYLFIILFFIVIPFIFILPVDYELVNNVIVPQGIPVLLTYGVSFILIIYSVYITIRYRKNIVKNKAKPLYIFVVLLIFNFLIQRFFPEAFLINFLLSLTVIIMYFTIENPDVKMIKQLNIAKDQAEKANRAKSEFLSNMSHEIRTPLNAIVGFSECLIESPNLDTEAKDHAKDIVDASNNLLEIVNGILDISKIEANKMEVVSKEYNPKEVFNGLCKLIIPRIGSKPIEFRSNITEDLPGILKGDVGKLKQVVLNILTNAAKYTDRGEIIFSVSCINRVDTKKCSLNIAVKDTGRGIKKEDINKLFNKFERFDEDQNTSTEGTGLGLAITKSLTEMMGGRITVSSNYGEGSTFRINIEQDLISMEAPVGSSEEIEIDYSLHTGKRILVVDDSKINLKVANNILKPYNFTIVEACSGFEALELAETGTFDLILMDIMMPKMNGVECLRRLKEIPGFDIPVVALTADAIEGQDEKYIQAGFNDYLSKPIDRYQLNRVLNKYLGGK